MKRRISLPERHATTVEAIAHRVAARWPLVERIATDCRPAALQATKPGESRTPGHSDPTVRNITDPATLHHQELVADIRSWVETGKSIERRVNAYLRLDPARTKAALANPTPIRDLCVEPGCDFEQVRRRRCWHHYSLLLTAERNPPTEPDASYHTSATPAATVARTVAKSVWCASCGRTFELPAGTDSTVWLEQHRRDCAA